MIERRLVYCFFAALALHASGLLTSFTRSKRPEVAPVEKHTAKATMIPLAIDDAIDDATEPSPPLEPVAPPVPPESSPSPPAPAEPTEPLAEEKAKPLVAVVPPVPARERVKKRSERRRDERKRVVEDATVFGGKKGAFRANVCFIPVDTESVRAVDNCQSVASFSTNEINVPPRRFKRGFPGVERRTEWFGIDFRGRFKVRASGYYTFRLVSDDGAVLSIDGEPLLDNDGLHGPRETKMSLPLSAGEHDFRLLYYQGPGSHLALQLFVKGYKEDERLFGPEF